MKSVLLLDNCKCVNFENFKRLIKVPFIIYGDFKCVLIPWMDNTDFGLNTKKYQDHIVCSYCYKLIWADEKYIKPYKTDFGEDAIDIFF